MACGISQPLTACRVEQPASQPAWNTGAYQAPTYQPTPYQPSPYQAPAYQAPAYQPPAYSSPPASAAASMSVPSLSSVGSKRERPLDPASGVARAAYAGGLLGASSPPQLIANPAAVASRCDSLTRLGSGRGARAKAQGTGQVALDARASQGSHGRADRRLESDGAEHGPGQPAVRDSRGAAGRRRRRNGPSQPCALLSSSSFLLHVAADGGVCREWPRWVVLARPGCPNARHGA